MEIALLLNHSLLNSQLTPSAHNHVLMQTVAQARPHNIAASIHLNSYPPINFGFSWLMSVTVLRMIYEAQSSAEGPKFRTLKFVGRGGPTLTSVHLYWLTRMYYTTTCMWVHVPATITTMSRYWEWGVINELHVWMGHLTSVPRPYMPTMPSFYFTEVEKNI